MWCDAPRRHFYGIHVVTGVGTPTLADQRVKPGSEYRPRPRIPVNERIQPQNFALTTHQKLIRSVERFAPGGRGGFGGFSAQLLKGPHHGLALLGN